MEPDQGNGDTDGAPGHRGGCTGDRCRHDEGAYPLCWTQSQVDEDQRRYMPDYRPATEAKGQDAEHDSREGDTK